MVLSKLLLLSVGLSLSARPVLAQVALAAQKSPAIAAPSPTPSAAARAEALTANMTQALGLTPTQVEKVRVINTASVRNVETARQRYAQQPAKLRSYIEEVSLARLDQLKDVLTPTQFTRYQQKREEKMGIPTLRGTQGTPPPGLRDGRGED